MRDLEIVGRGEDILELNLPDIDMDIGIRIKTYSSNKQLYLSMNDIVELNKWLTEVLEKYNT